MPLDPVADPTLLELEIHVDEPLVPAAVGLADDSRTLGIAVRSIRVE